MFNNLSEKEDKSIISTYVLVKQTLK